MNLSKWLTNTFELTHSHQNQKNIASMEGIRGMAAFLVFIVHFSALFEESVGINNQVFLYDIHLWLRNIGNTGVDLFFVLSGYLIYGTIISKKTEFIPYMKRRINRIYPTFIFMFALYLILSFLMPDKSKIPLDQGDAILYLVQSFLLLPPLFANSDPLLAVAWSLSYEMFFYILIPVLVGILRMRDWKSNYRIGFFISIATLGYLYFYFNEGPIRVLMFISGILLYETVKNKKQINIPYWGSIIFIVSLIAIVMLMIYKVPHGSWIRQVIIFIAFFILCYECFIWATPSSTFFSHSSLRWFGNMSYSYYLMHGLVMKLTISILGIYVFQAPLENVFFFFIIGISVFFISLIPSILLFSFI